jgi:glutamine synthetase
MSTILGENLFEPGSDPSKNTKFLVFTAAVIAAVDNYQDLLRVSVASAGNDHRLGANEAPPAIVSIFLGDEITAVIDALLSDKSSGAHGKSEMSSGVNALPSFTKDSTDRNRTSPFSFTGNKFEFRMVGSAFSISGPNFVLNTIVAEELDAIAVRIEKGEKVLQVVKDVIKKHNRIIFNGNNYAEEWVVEAKKRGLLNLKNTVDALPHFIADKNIALFTKHKILTEAEIRSRYEILMESYCKTVRIEALTLSDIVRHDILPATAAFGTALATGALEKKKLIPELACKSETELLKKISVLSDTLYTNVAALDKTIADAKKHEESIVAHAKHYRESVLPAMLSVRTATDELEGLVGSAYWPMPTYGELLFGV